MLTAKRPDKFARVATVAQCNDGAAFPLKNESLSPRNFHGIIFADTSLY